MAKAKKAAPKGKSKKGGPIRVDFTGVEGKRSTLPDDDYLVEVEAVEVKDGNEYPYFELTLVVQAGKFKGQKMWDRMSTSPGALWRLRSFLEVIGMEVPDEEMEIDQDELVGTQFVAVTAQEKYKNDDDEKKVAVRMVDFYSADDFKEKEESDDEDEDEDEKPKSKKKDKVKDKKASKKSKKDDDDEDEEEAEEAEEEEDDEDETPEERKKRLRKERRAKRKGGSDEDEDEDEKPKKKGKKSKKDEDEEEEDEEEEEAPKSKKKAGKKKKGGDKVSADTVNEADEDDLEALIKEHDLEVDLDDFKTLRKKQAAVIDALETADLLEDDE